MNEWLKNITPLKNKAANDEWTKKNEEQVMKTWLKKLTEKSNRARMRQRWVRLTIWGRLINEE
jgi:hypothetical protein